MAASSPRTRGEEEELGLLVLLDPRQVVDVLGTILCGGEASLPFDSGGDQGMMDLECGAGGEAVQVYFVFSPVSSHFCARDLWCISAARMCTKRIIIRPHESYRKKRGQQKYYGH
jgi:hypothetical protein